MKKLFFLLLTVCLVVACSKKDSLLTQGKATFKINNISKEFIKVNSFNKGVLTLGNTKQELISISFPVPSTFPRTYTIESNELVIAAYTLNSKTYSATSGILGVGRKGALSITVTKYEDGKISGTFSFTAIADDATEIKITNGVFTNIPDL